MSNSIAVDVLRQHIEAIEQLESEKAGISDDIKDRYSALKAEGFNVKACRKIVSMRSKEASARTQEETDVALYAAALGVQLGFDI